ncbi:MAG TPA: DUF2892 domain-containing protein [Longilinea sp.]|nr:DUF2892 domain-containing protein [Longilinea sp.]
MKRNESTLDRILRIVAGAVLLLAGFGGVLSGAWAIIADALGIILVLTGATGICPLYMLFKFSTLKK